ncbi:glycosyltransferase, partial [Clostridium beijerinckii]|uniref:glycosyltransferase n=1 Tax=Clostridium beijerinckii TaxID=1520 RepID=UPI0022E6EC5A
MCKLSIIVPIYNVERYLDKCIDSILNQSFKDFELILVDDGSPDKCGDICNSYSKLDRRIKVIHKQNGGLSSARNAGLDIAVGEYIAFVDSDDWINGDMYDTLYCIAKENNADIVQCRFKKVYNDIEEYVEISKKVNIIDKIEALTNLIAYGEMHVQSVVTWNKIYKRMLFDDIRFPQGKIHEDEFTTYKFFYKSKKIVLCDDELYYYRQVDNSIMNTKFNKKRLDYLDALEEMYNFFKQNKKLHNLVMIRYIDSYRTYYFKCKELLK